MKSSREQFEEWAEDVGALPWGYLKKQRTSGGGYSVQIYNYMWSAWQASRAEIEVELPSMEDPANLFCEVYSCDMVHESLASCGLKVKS